MNDVMGPELFAKLMGGETINKRIYKNGALVDNPLFTELFTHHDSYTKTYASQGFSLRLEQDFYMLSDRTSDPHMDVAMKVCALIEILSRQMAFIPLSSEALLDAMAGLPRTQIEEMATADDVNDIMKALSLIHI